MSQLNLDTFVQRVRRDADLKTRAMEASDGPLEIASVKVAALSEEVGLPFTAAEFQQAVAPQGTAAAE